KRKKALAGAASLRPREDLGACPIKVDMPAVDGSKRDFMNLGFDPVRSLLQVVPRKELASPGPGPMWRKLEGEITVCENDVRYGTLENDGDEPVQALIARVGGLSDPGSWDHDFVLLADELVEPKSGELEFSPGRIRGRLFVYSYKTAEIVC